MRPKLSVVIPVYNEKNTVLEVIKRVKSVNTDKEIIVVDDGSTDGTKDILKNINGVKFISHTENQGKGTAIRTGLKYITGDFVIIQDGDLEYNPQEYLNLLTKLKNNKGFVVYGSRFKGNSKFCKSSFVGNKILTFITNLLFSSKLTDMETCYKCIKREVIQSIDLTARRFEFEPEVTAKLLRKGYKILEVPIFYSARTENKKIGLKDGIQAIFTLIKWRIK